MHLLDLKQQLDANKTYLVQQQTKRTMLEEQRQAYVDEIETSKKTLEVLDQSVALIGQYADARELEIQKKIETLVTNGLKTVFNEDMRFVVQQKVVGKRTDIKFKIESYYDGVFVETDILSARGGGVASVTGFLLRVIMVLLTGSRRILFLDETFAQVSDDYLPNVAQLLDDLSQEYGFQFILVTHRNPEIIDVSDRVYRASMKSGKTQYELVSV